MNKVIFLITAVAAVAGYQTPVAAAPANDPKPIFVLACANAPHTAEDEEWTLPIPRLADAALINAGYIPWPALATGNYDENVVEAVLTKSPTGFATAIFNRARDVGLVLKLPAAELAKGYNVKFKGRLPNNNDNDLWVFKSEGRDIVCLKPMTQPDIVDRVNEGTSVPSIGVVGDIKLLALTGEERRAAGSALVSVNRTKVEKTDGTTKTSTNLSFDGVAGIRLSSREDHSPSFFYVDYSLARNRERPAAPLAANARRDDGDTNGLELGFLFADVSGISRTRDISEANLNKKLLVSLSAHAGYTVDFVNDSQRIVGNIGFDFQPPTKLSNFGICKIGGYTEIEIFNDYQSRCYARADALFSHVFKAGRADFGDNANFFMVGGQIGISIVPPADKKTGIVADVSYRYLAPIAGKAPRISRLEGALKHRWWFDNGVAFDFGGSYTHGREEKTFSKQDILALSFGILY
jgi:hypothetical protein